MANVRTLVLDGRRLEQAGDPAGAIERYRKALSLQENEPGGPDIGLYNRVGDLYLRHGNLRSAIAFFEKAADRYEEQQLHANAIAVCKKILRNAPGYTEAYRRAGRLLARANLAAEARASYLEYAERMERQGSLERALEGLHEFVRLSGDEEVRLTLAERHAATGETSKAVDQLRSVWERRTDRGEDAATVRRRILELDPAADPAASLREDAGADPSTPDAQGEPDTADGPVANAAPASGGDVTALAAELQEVLSRLEGEEKLRQALPVIEQLLELEPRKVSLLLRKLEYSLALGEEDLALEAYLGLGAALEDRLERFSLRFISTSSPAGPMTTALRVEERPASSASD